jgi:hypothetical protein
VTVYVCVVLEEKVLHLVVFVPRTVRSIEWRKFVFGMNLAFARPIVSISVVQPSLWPQELIVDRRVLFLFYTANDVDQYSWRDNWDCFVEQDRTQVDQDNDVGVDAVLPHFPNCSVVVAIPVVDDFGFVVGAVHQTNDDGRCDEVKVLPAQRHWRCKATHTNFPLDRNE